MLINGHQFSYRMFHQVPRASHETRRAILEAMDYGPPFRTAMRSAKKAVWVIREGKHVPIEGRAELILETAEGSCSRCLPRDCRWGTIDSIGCVRPLRPR